MSEHTICSELKNTLMQINKASSQVYLIKTKLNDEFDEIKELLVSIKHELIENQWNLSLKL